MCASAAACVHAEAMPLSRWALEGKPCSSLPTCMRQPWHASSSSLLLVGAGVIGTSLRPGTAGTTGTSRMQAHFCPMARMMHPSHAAVLYPGPPPARSQHNAHAGGASAGGPAGLGPGRAAGPGPAGYAGNAFAVRCCAALHAPGGPHAQRHAAPCGTRMPSATHRGGFSLHCTRAHIHRQPAAHVTHTPSHRRARASVIGLVMLP